MNLIPEILDLQGEFEKIRHQIHENPELGFDELYVRGILKRICNYL